MSVVRAVTSVVGTAIVLLSFLGVGGFDLVFV